MARKAPRFQRGVFVSGLLFLAGCADSAPTAEHGFCPLSEIPDSLSRETVEVAGVTDGDTLILADGRRVRLIGINTPERARDGRPAEPLAERAATATQKFVDNSDRVWLVPDRERKDQYGRSLGHIFNGRGANLEASLLAQGLGWHVAVPPNLRLAPCLASVERRARKRELGVWQQQPVSAGAIDSGGFKRVRGRVDEITFADAWWLSLEGRMAAVIYPEHQHRFRRGTIEALEGRMVELQGWVYPSRSDNYEPWRMKLETRWGMEKL